MTEVVDTCGALIEYMKEWEMRTDPKASKTNGGFSLAEMNVKLDQAYETVGKAIAQFESMERQLKETQARLIEVEELNLTLREMLVKEIAKHI